METNVALQQADDSTFAGHLRNLRTGRKISMEAAAGAAGIHRSTLHRWERGEAKPRMPELDALLSALAISAPQKRQAVALLDAPRAKMQARQEIARIGERTGLGPMPSGGDLLRAMRLRRGLPLEMAAQALGVTTRTLRFWEKSEIAPPPERMAALFALLNALPEERQILMSGAFFLHPPLRETAAAPDALRLACQPWFWPDFHTTGHQGPHPAPDLTYLTLAAQAWRLARVSAEGRNLLAEIYGNYADYLNNKGRQIEAEQYAERALEIAPRAAPPLPFVMHAAVNLAQAKAYQSGKAAPRRGLEVVRLWLPVLSHPTFGPWMQACRAIFLARDGQAEAANKASEAAYDAAQDYMDGIDLRYRLRDRVDILLNTGRAAEALSLLAPHPGDAPGLQVDLQLRRVAALAMLNARAEAQSELRNAEAMIAAQGLTGMKEKADLLAQNL